MMFNRYCYKYNNYGHKAIHYRDHEKITPRRNQGGFFFLCYNCYHYGHFTKHCKMQGHVKVWRRNKVQLNDINNHQPTKVWRIKLVYCTIDQNRNDENIGKTQYHFEDYRPVIWSVKRMCKRRYVPDCQKLEQQTVCSRNILVTEYKFIKVATVPNDRGSNIVKGSSYFH